MSSHEIFSNIEFLDKASKIAVQAKLEGLTKTQIENISTSLYMVENERDCLLITQLYSQRQAARLRKGYNFAKLVNEILNEIYIKGGKREDASKLLGLVKWIYESIEDIRLPRVDIKTINFNELMKILRGS